MTRVSPERTFAATEPVTALQQTSVTAPPVAVHDDRGRLRRLIAVVDESPVAQTAGAMRVRRLLALLFATYAVLLATQTVARGDLPKVSQLLMLMLAGALASSRSAAFVRDWGLVLVGVFAYVLTSSFVGAADMPVHYRPQLEADKLLGLGSVPTVWLQQQLYHGRTGPLELFSMAMYLSHFFVPLLLGYYMWWRHRRHAFGELMFGLLAVSLLAQVIFVLAPTAPPWLASEHGLLPPVHHIIKSGLLDLHLDAVASLYGVPGTYNLVAALPSMHAAFPFVALLVVLRHGLPRWVLALQGFQVVGVLFAIVYTGEHYVVDALAGYVYAAAAWYAVARGLGRGSGTQTERVRIVAPQPVPR